MPGESHIDPGEFVSAVKPLLQIKDLDGLLHAIKSRWSADQITSLLASSNCDARKVAALALSLVGRECCIPPLADRLKDPDPFTNQMAEHALWSIWFRTGSPEANHHICRGAKAIDRRDFEHAIHHFTKAIELCPRNAEAYNQRAIALYFIEKFDESIADCQRAVERMPCHFGAWAGMGHCHAHLGRINDAICCYEQALAINPHLDCVRQTLDALHGGRPGSPDSALPPTDPQ